jgi:hypothetical protein
MRFLAAGDVERERLAGWNRLTVSSGAERVDGDSFTTPTVPS